MIKPSAPPHAVRKWIAISTAIIALGCRPPGGFRPSPAEWNTPLPPGVDANAATFHARVARAFPASGNSHTRARPSATCYPCMVQVKIEALGDTRLINPYNGPETGVAVARIENLDSKEVEGVFGFRPGIQAVYYLWVDRKPRSTAPRWTVLQVPMGAGIVTAGRQWDLVLCHRWPVGYRPSSDADFYEYRHGDRPCDAVGTAERSGIQQASLISTERLAAFVGGVVAFLRGGLTVSDGGWIDCNMGCCT